MLDIKLLRENPDLIKRDLEKRRDDEKLALLDRILLMDLSWRSLKHEEDSLRKKRNELSQKINEAKKAGQDAVHILDEAKKIPDLIKESEQKKTCNGRRNQTRTKSASKSYA